MTECITNTMDYVLNMRDNHRVVYCNNNMQNSFKGRQGRLAFTLPQEILSGLVVQHI